MHVLTACTRVENLEKVAWSLLGYGTLDIRWHLRFDLDHQFVGGQRLKNEMLDEVKDGWVCFLDDDTVMHPSLLRRFDQTSAQLEDMDGLVVSQERRSGRILHADQKNVTVGGIDVGQVILHRQLIADTRIPEHYDGDGMFLQEVLLRGRIAYLDEVLSYHNALREEVTA
jgi:hypothetical protein